MGTEHQAERTRTSGKTASVVTWSITALLGLGIVAVAVYAYNRESAPPPEPQRKLTPVEVVTVRPREYNETLTLPARLQADRVAAVRPEFGGILARWHVAEGMEVAQGQLVARLDTEEIDTGIREIRAALQTAQKNVVLARAGQESAEVALDSARKRARLEEIAVAAARSELELSQADFRRAERLYATQVTNTASLDQARNDLNQAKLAHDRAQEALDSARLGVRGAEVRIKEARAGLDMAVARADELKAAEESLNVKRRKTALTAPISGKIEEHLVEPGEVVMAGAVLANVYDLQHIRAIVNVPDRYVSFLDPANPALQSFIGLNMPGAEQRIRSWLVIPGLPKLTGGNGRGLSLEAEIVRIAQASDAASNTFPVVLRLPNPSEALRHGIIAQGRVEYLHYPRAIVIPVKAVQVTDEGPRVLVVEDAADGPRVRLREIEPVSVRGGELLIGRGLAAGERLVVAGWKGLVDGEQVRVLVEDGRFVDRDGPEGPSVAPAAKPETPAVSGRLENTGGSMGAG